MILKRKMILSIIASAYVVTVSVTAGLSQNVGPDGSFGYSIPIEVPPGTNGVQPSLSIDYNSNSGNGTTGLGWSLNGIPSITRKPSSRINYDGNDTYVTGEGNDLVKYNADDSYHSKIETFSKYEPVGSQGDGPEYWIEHKPDGSKLYYGSTRIGENATCLADSRQFNGNKCVRVWSLSKAVDANGNQYNVEYYQRDGEIYPISITYCFGDSINKFQQVLFYYEGRDDWNTHYIFGTPVSTQLRLKSIKTQVGVIDIFGWKTDLFSTICRFYNFDYIPGNGSPQHSIISNIMIKDGKNAEIKNVNLVWDNNSTGYWNTYPDINVGVTSDEDRFRYSDVNGDGFLDIGVVGNANPTGILFNMNGSEPWAYSVFSGNIGNGDDEKKLRWHTADLNGDNFEDILYNYQSDIYIHYNNNFDWNYSAPFQGAVSSRPFFLDFNGDGVQDVAGILRKSHIVSGSGEDSDTEVTDGVAISISTYKNLSREVLCEHSIATGLDDCESRIKFADFNGDGATDIAFIDATNSLIRIWVNLNGTMAESYSLAISNSDPKRYFFVDINGDGKSDIVHLGAERPASHWVYINTGAEFIEGAHCYSFGDGKYPGRYHYADMNADGKTDIVYVHDNGNVTGTVYLQLGTGSGWSEVSESLDVGGGVDWRYMLADLNGDGKPDIIHQGGSVEKYHLIEGRCFSNESTNKLVTIKNRNDTTCTVTYTHTSKLPESFTNEFNSYPRVANNTPRYLATKIETTDGRGSVYTTSCTYKNGRTYMGLPSEAKDLGFENITQTKHQTGEKQITYYEQNNYNAGGMPIRIVSYLGNGKIACIKEITNQTVETKFGTKCTRAVRETNQIYESGIYRYTASSEYFFDHYGNMNKAVSFNGVSTIQTDVIYSIDEANWLLSRPKESKTTSNEKVLSWQQLEYEGANPVAKSVWFAEGDKWIKNYFSYYTDGRIKDTTDALGVKTSIIYNGTTIRISDGLGHVAVKEVDQATGKVIKETDANGYSVNAEYDSQGRQILTSDENGWIKRVIFVNEGNPNTQYAETQIRDTSKLGYSFSRSYYDGLGREYKQVSKQQSDDGINGLFQITEKILNNKGQLIQQVGPYISADVNGTDADSKYSTFYEYDDSGRPCSVRKQTAQGDIIVTSAVYSIGSNLCVTSKDPKGYATLSIYNPAGKLVRKEEPEGGVISYSYDETGKLTGTNVNGSSTAITYDSLGRRIAINDPNKGVTSYTYDDLGRVSAMTDAKGQVTQYQYDSAGRIIKEDNPDGTRDVNYSYDTAVNGLNRIARINDGEIVTEYAYDKRGNVTFTKQSIDGYNFRFSMEYDIQNRITGLTYPNGKKITNRYSDAGNLAAVCSAESGGAFVKYGIPTADSYTASGTGTDAADTAVSIANIRNHTILRHTADGINTEIQYDPSTQKPTGLKSFYGTSSDSLYEDIKYVYDANGNIEKISDSVKSEQNQTFVYDTINRLRQATGIYGTETYEYTVSGNLKKKGNKVLQYDSILHPQAVTSAGGVSYSYDKNGNMTSRGNDILSYDAKNRLISFQSSSKTESYTYDHSGQRIKKSRKDGTDIYSIGGMYELTKVPKNNPAHTMYIYGLKGDLVAQRTYVTSSMTDTLAENYYLDGMHSNNPLKRIYCTIAFELIKDRGLSKDIHRLAPWMFLVLGALVLVFGIWNRILFRKERSLFKRLCADLVPLVLCIFISGSGLAACGTPDIPDETDDPVYTDVKATASPSPQHSASPSASSSPANAAESPDTSTGITLGGGGTNLAGGGSNLTTPDTRGIPREGTYYFHPDHLGTTRYMTKPAAGSAPVIVWESAYTPYGERIVKDKDSEDAMSLNKTYTGQTEDFTDLMYYNARYYDPGIGRFITADDIVPEPDKSQSYNRYMYVDGNPVNFQDISGNSKVLGTIRSICKDIVNDVTFRTAYKNGGWKGVAVKAATNGIVSYSYEGGYGIGYTVQFFETPIFFGASYQQKGYNKGFSFTLGFGYVNNYGNARIGIYVTQNLNNGNTTCSAGLTSNYTWGQLSIMYSKTYDSYGNKIFSGWQGSSSLNLYSLTNFQFAVESGYYNEPTAESEMLYEYSRILTGYEREGELKEMLTVLDDDCISIVSTLNYDEKLSLVIQLSQPTNWVSIYFGWRDLNCRLKADSQFRFSGTID